MAYVNFKSPERNWDCFDAGRYSKCILHEIPELRSIGRATARRAKTHLSLEGHSHPYLIINYIERGTFNWWTKKEIHETSGGQIYIIQPNEHFGSIGAMWYPSKLFWVGVDLESKTQNKGDSFLGLPKKLADSLMKDLNHIHQRIFHAPTEIVENFNFIIDSMGKPYHYLLHLKIQEHFIRILTTVIEAARKNDSSHYSIMVHEAIRFMDHSHNEPLSLPQIVKKLGWSASYFHEKFRNEIGITPAEFYLKKRLTKAQALLQHTNKTSHEISLEAGFSSDSYFIKVFKRFFGITPQFYRSNCRMQKKT